MLMSVRILSGFCIARSAGFSPLKSIDCRIGKSTLSPVLAHQYERRPHCWVCIARLRAIVHEFSHRPFYRFGAAGLTVAIELAKGLCDEPHGGIGVNRPM